MILKTKYLPYGSEIEHFEGYYIKYLDSKLKNEEEFVSSFIESLPLETVEKIISKYSNYCNKKEKEFISYIDNTSSFNIILDRKLKVVFEKYDDVSKEYSYPRLIVYFINQLLANEDSLHQSFKLKLTHSFYDNIHAYLEKSIVSNVNHLICYLNGLRNFDIKDVLSAYIVLDKNKANNIFEKTITSDLSKWNFEVILFNWKVNYNDECFIPNVRFLEKFDIDKKNVFEIEKMPYNDFVKHLLSFKYTDRLFQQNNLLNSRDIKNKELFIDLLTELFKRINKSFTRKDVEILFYSLNPDNLWKHSNETLIKTQLKINEKLIEYNSKAPNHSFANRLLCAFLYKLKENKFIKANSITDAFQEYFVPEVQLSKATFNNLIYSKIAAEQNYEENKDLIDSVIPDSVFRKKGVRKKYSY